MSTRKSKRHTKANGTDASHTNGGDTHQSNGTTKHAGPGRPTTYTPELGREICELTAMRVPLVRICEMPGMPSERTVYAWKRLHPDFLREYTRAREHRADARADRIDEICEQLQAGKLDPNTARVLIDAEKWQAGKENAKRYGDRINAELSGPDGAPVQIEAAAAIKALVEALPGLGVLKPAGHDLVDGETRAIEAPVTVGDDIEPSGGP